MKVNLLPWREVEEAGKKKRQVFFIFIVFFLCFFLMGFLRFFLLQDLGVLKKQISHIDYNVSQMDVSPGRFFSRDNSGRNFNLLCQVLAYNRVFLLALKSIYDFLPEGGYVLKILKSGNDLVVTIDQPGDWLKKYRDKLMKTRFFKRIDVGFLKNKINASFVALDMKLSLPDV